MTDLTAQAQASKRRQTWVDRGERFGLVIAWVVVIVVFTILEPGVFLTWTNFSTIFGSQATLVVLALGLIVPLTAGDYDLSIASNLTLTSMLIAVLNVYNHVPLAICLVAAVAAGVLIGAVNAFLVLYFRINSLIVTLGMGTFLHGVTLWFSGSNTISGIDFALPTVVIITRLFGIPLAFYFALILALVIWYVFSYTAAGQRLLFVGRGREVARLSGIRVDRVRAATLIASGVLGSLAGILYAGTTGSADPSSGQSLLLPAFAAAFLGGTSITPGRFNPIGSVIAVYFLVTGIAGLSILGISTFVQDLFYGGALVVAVALSQVVRGRQERTT
jgi:ribose transport system permease protein